MGTGHFTLATFFSFLFEGLYSLWKGKKALYHAIEVVMQFEKNPLVFLSKKNFFSRKKLGLKKKKKKKKHSSVFFKLI